MANHNQDETLVEKLIRRFKNNQLTACLILVITVLVFTLPLIEYITSRLEQAFAEVVISVDTIPGGEIQQESVWEHKDEKVRLRGTIVTHGHQFTLHAKYLIAESAAIKTFEEATAASTGINGTSGSPGKNGEGDGVNGDDGESGEPGDRGDSGATPRNITIESQNFKGALSIFASGQQGGAGGVGGEGGKGGDGAKGSESELDKLKVSCAKGPGKGGKGGAGGNGGEGGKGGSGGDGSHVNVSVTKSFRGTLRVEAIGGEGGKPGDGGKEGQPGTGGAEGKTRPPLCNSAGNNGAGGNQGDRGGLGSKGNPGQDGAIVIRLPQIQQDTKGKFEYSSS